MCHTKLGDFTATTNKFKDASFVGAFNKHQRFNENQVNLDA